MRIPVRIRRVVILCLVFLMLSSGTVSAKTAFSEDPEAIEEAAQSVLFLMTDTGSGSGFILSDGQTLVTNYHVIEGTRHLLCTDEFGECYLFTEVLIADKQKDIAILHAPEPTGLKAFMADTDRPLRGEKVVAIGSPKSFFKTEFINSVSIGNVSNFYYSNNRYEVLFTAPISPGNSGGPLFNDDGKVIGITSGQYLPDEANDLYYAVHISEVLALYEQWDGTTVYPIAEHENACVDQSGATSETAQTPSPKQRPKGTRVPLPTQDPNATPAPRPEKHNNGEMILSPDYACTQKLTLTPDKNTNCYIYLQCIGDTSDTNVSLSPKAGKNNAQKRDISFYCVAGGPSVTVKVPPGRYKVYLAAGKTFFNSSLLFGSDSQFFICKGKYTPNKGKEIIFDIGGNRAKISLETGNENTVLFEPIDPDRFPGT